MKVISHSFSKGSKFLLIFMHNIQTGFEPRTYEKTIFFSIEVDTFEQQSFFYYYF